MEFDLWLGNEASYQVVQDYLSKFNTAEFMKEAFRAPVYGEDKLDPVFGVEIERPGLTLLRKIGDQTVMQIAGSLVPNYSYWHRWARGEVVSYEAIRDALAICEESGVTDLIMHFDTNGGSVRGMSQTSDAMKRFQRTGKIRAHSDALVASAGYWLYCGANECTASEMAEIGNIGTMAVVRTLVNTEQNMGMKFTVIKAGKWKALGSPFEELTAERKAKLQENVDETNDFFLKRVSVQRNLMLSESGVWAEGLTFFAGKARQVGLIDKVTTMDDLLGSGPAADNPSETRRMDMEIPAEKLAQIQAGADPKVVLTAAELEVYMAGIEALKNDGGEPVKTEATKEPAKEPSEPAEPAPVVNMTDDYKKLLTDHARLEVKLEGAAAELAALKTQNEGLQASLDSLVVVAQTSVTKLQLALGKPQVAKATPTELLAQYNELQADMAKVFKTGQQSSDAPITDTTKVTGGPLDFRLAGAQPQKTGR